MNNTETKSREDTASQYWTTIAVSGLIFGFAAFFIKTLLTYIRLQVAPHGALLSVYLILGIIGLAWLIKACGGGFACWYFNKASGLPVVMGRAAMMGFLTGAAITIVSIILNAIWHWIAPGMIQQKLQSDIAIIKALDMPAEQKKQFIKSVTINMKSFHNPGQLFLSGIFIYGIPNLITGMIAAKIFGRKNNEQTQKQDSRAN
jgi:hypothetical protein